MNYPLMLRNETPQDYAKRHGLNLQVVMEALRNNEITIDGRSSLAQPAQHEKPLSTPPLIAPNTATVALAVSETKSDSAKADTLPAEQRQEKWQELQHDAERRHEEWRRLHREGNAISDIAAKTDSRYVQVYKFLVDNGLHKPGPRSSPRDTNALEALESEEVRLQAELAAVERKKQLLIEAKKLHVEPLENGEGVIIKKEGNVVIVTFEEARQLAEMLIDFLPRSAVEEQVQ